MTIFQIELHRLKFITKEFLDALTLHQIPISWGRKKNGYYLMKVTPRPVNNFDGTVEVEAYNILMQICINKGYSFLMIQI